MEQPAPLQTQATSVSSCTTISSPGVYILTANITGSSANPTCMSIQSNDVILDCQGNIIDGLDSSNTNGVRVQSRSNITVQNCRFSDWTWGIYLETTLDSQLINNTGYSSQYGIMMREYSRNNLLSGNNCSYNYYGINLYDARNNTLTNNIANNNYKGLYIQGSNSYNNILTNNIANYNTQYEGIYVGYGTNNTLINNTANSNYYAGIRFEYGQGNNTLINNTANNNTQYGIYMYSNSNNTLINNTANGNSNYGIYAGYGARYNSLTDNFVCANQNKDIYIDSDARYNFGNNTCSRLVNYTATNVSCPIKCPFIQGVCGQYLANNTVLTEDMLRCQAEGVRINASNIVLDCDNHTIEGRYSQGSFQYGVNNQNGFDNVTVKNCFIRDFLFGMHFTNNANNCTIYNNTLDIYNVTDQISRSIYFYGNYNNITKNNVGNKTTQGIYVDLNYNVLSNNTACYATQWDLYTSGTGNSGDNTCGTLSSSGVNCSQHCPFVQGVCGQNIFENATLTQDIIDCRYSGAKIERTANVTLDCDGHAIRGYDDRYYFYGVFVQSPNTTIKNCTISKFEIGIYSDRAGGQIYSNNISLNNYGLNVVHQNVHDNIICRNFESDIYSSGDNSGDNICSSLTGSVDITCNTSCGFTQGACAQTIVENTTLTDDILGCARLGIKLGANNIMLDCGNHTIRSTTGNDYGVRLSNHYGNTIKNCIVDMFNVGSMIEASQNNVLVNNTFNNSVNYGLYIPNANNNQFTGNTISSSSQGIVNSGSSNNTFTNNRVLSNGQTGITIVGHNNTFVNNTVTGSNRGFHVGSATYNNLTDNVACVNREYDIYIDSASTNNFGDNICSFKQDDDTNTGLTCSTNCGYVAITSCQPLTARGNYMLQNDISNGYDQCIRFDADNIVLDCNGHTITGTGGGNGIYASSRTNLTIKNCVLKMFSIGLYLGSVSNSNLINNTANNNQERGIAFYWSSNNNLTQNTASSNNYAGIYLEWSSGNILTNNTENNNNQWGINLYYGAYNNLTNNKVNANSYGIGLSSGSNNNILTDNSACSRGSQDIYLAGDATGNSGDNICNSSKIIDDDSNTITCSRLCPPCALYGDDEDNDGICGNVDNCPTVPNPNQVDSDTYVTEINFTHTDYGPEQDCIEPDVCLFRNSNGPIYNTMSGPIAWACGTCGGETTPYYSSNVYDPYTLWRIMRSNCFRGDNRNIPGSDTCLQIINSNSSWDVHWTNWTYGPPRGGPIGGGFAYTRMQIIGDDTGDACDCGADNFCTALDYCCDEGTLDADCGSCSAPTPGPQPTRAVASAPTTITEAFGGGTFDMFVGGTVNFAAMGESHSAKLKTVTSGYVTIDIYSSPITVTLSEGESKDIDMDGNSLNDLRIELLQILLPDGARIKLTPLQESLPSAPIPAAYTYCGDGSCGNGENAVGCPADCAKTVAYAAPTAMFSRQSGSLVTFLIILLLAAVIYVVWHKLNLRYGIKVVKKRL